MLGQCLNAVSEDNADVITALRSREAELLAILAVSSVVNKLLLLKTLVAGTLCFLRKAKSDAVVTKVCLNLTIQLVRPHCVGCCYFFVLTLFLTLCFLNVP